MLKEINYDERNHALKLLGIIITVDSIKKFTISLSSIFAIAI